MFAVIKTGGKQYRVAPDDTLRVARLNGEPGEIVELTDVLMVGGEIPVLGNPVPGATVAAEVVTQWRGPKIIAFKKRRRKNSRRKRGYRDEFTLIRITEILTDGKKPSKEARPKPARKPAAAPADAGAQETSDSRPAKKPAAKAKALAAKPKSKAAPKRKSADKRKGKK